MTENEEPTAFHRNAHQALDIRPIDMKQDRDLVARFLELLSTEKHRQPLNAASACGSAVPARREPSRAAEERSQPLDAVLAEAIAGRFPLSGSFGAYRQRDLVAVACGQLLPGNSASLWLPRLAPGEPESTAATLFARLAAWLEEMRLRIAQLLLESPTSGETALLENHGFAFLTGLLYMVCQWDEYPATPPAAELVFDAYCEANHQRLKKIIEETYHGTLDCPQLNDVRDIDDVLAGYRANGVYDPARWLLVSRQGQDVGCLLLADYPSDGNLELVYMGVVPSRRGEGLGVAIARHSAWVARQMGRQRVVVAVDVANTPAVRMYEMAGFWLLDRREVYLRVFDRKNG